MTDTSKEAIERAICNPIIRMVDRGGSPNLDACGLMIDTARALLAERDALQEQLNSPAHAAKVLLGSGPHNEVVDLVLEAISVDDTDDRDAYLTALRAIAIDTTTATCDNKREGE